MLCSVSDMVRLSAILTQISKGDYISEKCVHFLTHILTLTGFAFRHNSEVLLQVKGQIAPPKCKVKVCV